MKDDYQWNVAGATMAWDERRAREGHFELCKHPKDKRLVIRASDKTAAQGPSLTTGILGTADDGTIIDTESVKEVVWCSTCGSIGIKR